MTDMKQPEALRLAKTLEALGDYNFNTEAAAELRRQHAEIESLRAKLDELARQEPVEIDWPDYHYQGMGCGLEDRGIRDRYEAMRHGWDQAIERVAECLPEKLYLAAGARPVEPAPAAVVGPSDLQLLKFYSVTTDAELIAAQAAHIEKLQAKLQQPPRLHPSGCGKVEHGCANKRSVDPGPRGAARAVIQGRSNYFGTRSHCAHPRHRARTQRAGTSTTSARSAGRCEGCGAVSVAH